VARLSRPKSALGGTPKRFKPYRASQRLDSSIQRAARTDVSGYTFNEPGISESGRKKEIREARQLRARANQILATAGANSNVENMLRNIESYSGLIGKFSAANAALIYWQDPDASLVHSKTDWKRLGREVRGDAKPIAVLIPIGGGRKVSQPEIAHLIERRRKMGWNDARIESEVSSLEARGTFIPTHTFGVGRVYDAKSVTGGRVLSEQEHLKVSEVYRYATAYARANYDVEYGPIGGARGYSNLVKKEDGSVRGHIAVLKVPGEEIEPLDTLVHEMSHHVLGHTSKISNEEYRKNRGRYEAETELASFMVLSHYKIDNKAHAAAYIGQWLKQHKQEGLGEESVARSMNAASVIIKGIDAEKTKDKATFDRVVREQKAVQKTNEVKLVS
jgi:hypothetical protein